MEELIEQINEYDNIEERLKEAQAKQRKLKNALLSLVRETGKEIYYECEKDGRPYSTTDYDEAHTLHMRSVFNNPGISTVSGTIGYPSSYIMVQNEKFYLEED